MFSLVVQTCAVPHSALHVCTSIAVSYPSVTSIDLLQKTLTVFPRLELLISQRAGQKRCLFGKPTLIVEIDLSVLGPYGPYAPLTRQLKVIPERLNQVDCRPVLVFVNTRTLTGVFGIVASRSMSYHRGFAMRCDATLHYLCSGFGSSIVHGLGAG